MIDDKQTLCKTQHFSLNEVDKFTYNDLLIFYFLTLRYLIYDSLEDYTPLADFHLLLDSIPEFAKNDRLKKVNDRIDEMQNNIQFMAKADIVMKNMSDIKNQLTRQIGMMVLFFIIWLDLKKLINVQILTK